MEKIIVAGGTSGIGLATAKLFAEKGASVIVTGRSEEKLAAARLTAPGITAISLDSTDADALKYFFAQTGHFHHLILTLSSSKGGGPFATINLTDLRAGFDGKFWPHLQTIQAALPWLDKDGSITIITAASSTAKLPGTAGLAAINGALEIMVPILAKELKPLRINAVSPGVIDTDWWNFLNSEEKSAAFESYAQGIAVGRIGNPQDVSNLIETVVHNSYINGSVLNVNGGLM
ncbi:SDR family oxidoreductase [[Flexibacter] sp. ATCC 35208]|uniref:SDR family oxidoreductase n=1 Tax=[Flexibacter] sp. ATCC 35208 TaxID=1936242 RepID=UPI0009CE2556|nr:SDR family oxidoreductase [[Flexibacter] sp. ATCC 35208]OMP79759.1 short-chain dehydrogenase [[Flexibacter] sp. ATCC 35208]